MPYHSWRITRGRHHNNTGIINNKINNMVYALYLPSMIIITITIIIYIILLLIIKCIGSCENDEVFAPSTRSDWAKEMLRYE